MKNTTLYFLLAIYAITTAAQCQSPATDPRFDDLEAAVKTTLSDYHAAGLAIAVVEKGKTIYAKGFGYRDYENQIPVDEQTLFCLGSCTKAFTASLMGILEGQGEISLNDRPAKYIPELKFYNHKMDKSIQIRHLLSHTTGLSNMSTESSMVLFPPKENEGLIPRLKYLTPNAEVGEEHLYCNFTYAIPAILSERITGENWADNMAKLIFEPIGMENSTVGFDQASKNANYSLGYAVHENQVAPAMADRIVGRAPAGDIYSNVDEMSKWMATWLNDGRYENKLVLPLKYTQDAISPLISIPAPYNYNDSTSVWNMAYGYGWGTEKDYHGYWKVHHSGAISGYSAVVILFPDEEIGITVLTNQSNSNLPYTISEMMEDCLLDIDRPAKEDEQIRYGQAVVVEPCPGGNGNQ